MKAIVESERDSIWMLACIGKMRFAWNIVLLLNKLDILRSLLHLLAVNAIHSLICSKTIISALDFKLSFKI